MNTDRRLSHWFIGYVTVLLFFAVGAITTLGIGWYETLILPAWMPPTELVAFVWAALFILTGISAAIVWDATEMNRSARTLISLYAGNALLILFWNYLFFGVHILSEASGVAFIIGLSVIVLVVRVSPISRRAALLLIPYLVWVILAFYLNYLVMALNP